MSNTGARKTYAAKSNAVSVPVEQKISVSLVSQSGSMITVNGTFLHLDADILTTRDRVTN